jgi:hypothetical protein
VPAQQARGPEFKTQYHKKEREREERGSLEEREGGKWGGMEGGNEGRKEIGREEGGRERGREGGKEEKQSRR